MLCYTGAMVSRSRRHRQSAPRERFLIPASQGHGLSVALTFPNSYAAGMSNLGYQSIYRQLARRSDVFCDRFFLSPDAAPPRSQIRGLPLDRFDVVAFSLTYENDFVNIVRLLDLAGIAVNRADRRQGPLLIAGGVAAFLNPEPLAEIFDAFVVGEAEEILDQLIDAMQASRQPADWRQIPGVYIPSGYQPRYTNEGRLAALDPLPGFPARIISPKTTDLNQHCAVSCMLSPAAEFADMALVEVSRGCPHGCRFCAAGQVYLPFRTRSRQALDAQMAALPPEVTRIGLLGSAVSDYPGLRQLITGLQPQRARISVSSLRVDALTDELIEALAPSHTTFTIAPEAGSERMRRVINKGLSAQTILAAAEALGRCGVSSLKLYFMIGLPTETDADIDAIAQLACAIRDTHAAVRGPRRLRRIVVSVNPFVPKPFTPFQWHPYAAPALLRRHIARLRRLLQAERKIMLQCGNPRHGLIQALLSRGDRRIGPLLIAAARGRSGWSAILREAAAPLRTDMLRQRTRNEYLPWHLIDHGINEAHLWREYCRALADAPQNSEG